MPTKHSELKPKPSELKPQDLRLAISDLRFQLSDVRFQHWELSPQPRDLGSQLSAFRIPKSCRIAVFLQYSGTRILDHRPPRIPTLKRSNASRRYLDVSTLHGESEGMLAERSMDSLCVSNAWGGLVGK